MKSRILGQINKNENYPLFSVQHFQSLQANQEKSEYLLNYLQYFLSRFDQQNFQRQKITPPLLQSFKDFSEILSNSYSILLPDNFDEIIKILSIENTILEVIPNSPNFLQLIDLIFYQCYQNSDSDIQKNSNSVILSLFSNQPFCQAFVSSGKYLDTISALVTYSNPQLTNFFFDYFLNDNFIQCFIEEDIKQNANLNENQKENKMSCSKFVSSYFTKIFFSETTKDEVRYQLIEFGSKLVVNIFNSLEKNRMKTEENQLLLSNLFIDELSKLSVFEKANKFFMSHPSLSFMSMFYNNLLLNLNNSDSNNQKFNPVILNYLHSLYIDDKFSIEDGKVVIMHFFQTLNINYFLNKNNFQILDWINDSVFQSSLLFQVTSSFLAKCVYYDTFFLSSFIDFFIQKVAPPAKEKFVYNEIFTWFLSLISLLIEDESKNHIFCFDVRKFLQKMIYEPSISDVSFYLTNFFNFKQLLLHISILCKENNKRNLNAKKISFTKKGQIIQDENSLSIQLDESIFDEQYFSKIIELIEFNLNEESLQEFFLNYLKNSFGKNLVLYFFQNISKSNHIQMLLFSFSQEFTNELIEIITSYKLLDEILKDLNEQNIMPILKIINSIVIKTNNHFFDDYIINNNNILSLLKKLDFNSLEKFILPAFYDEPIPIPSLIPFLNEIVNKEKLNFKSPYNYYLLGCYAMPIYNKLKVPVSRILCLEEIFNQFIRFNDFCYVFQNGAKDASMIIQANKKPEFSSNIYEIFPSGKPASILLNITSPYCAFKIRFESKHHFPSVLFNVNGSPFLFVKDDYLIDISNTSIGQIQLNKWHTISFIYKQNVKILSIGLDSEIVSSLSISSNLYVIDSIGSSQKPASIHFMVMNSIAFESSTSTFSEELASKYFKPQGNTLFVPNYSFHHLFQSRYAFSKFCEMIENTITVKNDNEIKKIYNDKTALFVTLMSNWISLNNVSSEWHLNRYRYCLLQNVSYCEPFYLTSILQSIICLNNKTDRTKLFYSFICDFFFWTKFPERIVGQCLDFINNFIDDFPSVFDLKMLEETMIGNFLLSLSYFYRNSYILNGLIRFLKTLFTYFDEKYVIPVLSNFAIISPYINIEEMEMIFNFEKGQNFGNTIISLAKEIRKTRNLKLFKIEDLLSFGLMVNNQQLAVSFIMRILIFCDSDQFVLNNLSILCRIVQRFPSNNLIWQKLFQLITNDKNFKINSNTNQYDFANTNNGGIRISILPLILSALIPLFNEESMFTENIKKIVFLLLKDNQLNLISKNTIKIFCAFLNGSIFGLVQPNLINQPNPQNPKIQDFYSIFVENLNRTFVSSMKPNPSFYKYTTMLLCSMLLTQVTNFKRFSLILNVAVHSSNYFLIQTLITLYSTYIHIELTSQQLTLLNDVSLYAFLNEKDLKIRDNLSNNIFVYCIHIHERFVYFAKFFVFSYLHVSNDVKFRTLRAFNEYFSIQPPKTLNDIIPYLCIITCTDLHQICINNKANKKENLMKKGENNSPKNIVSNERRRRLMNLKAKEPNNDSIDSSTINQIDSFASEIFNYFLATFKQFPKESKLPLLLKYKDFNDLNSHKNENDENLNQIKNYLNICMKNLQDESYNNYKIVDLKGTPIPQDNLGTFLFAHFTDLAQRCKNFFNTLISDMNLFLRHVEKYYGSFIYINNTITSQNCSYDMLNEINQSFHVSPFYFPGFCPVVLMPSPFSVLKNNNKNSEDKVVDSFCSNKIKIELFGLEKLISFTCHKTNDSKIDVFDNFDGFFDYRSKNHKMKISFIHNTNTKKHKINVYYLQLNSEAQQQEKILLFESIYGRPLQILNCNLIRKFIDIPAVLFKYKNRYLILPNFQFDGEELNVVNETIESTLNLTSVEFFYQSVFLNEFGQYYIFLGHPVILVHFNEFVISHQCTDDTVTFSVGIFSTSNGSFILSFSRENIVELQQKYQQLQQNEQLQQVQEESVVDPPSIYMMTNSENLKQSIIDKWLNGKLSNIHYLTLLNLLSGRSFDDLASYPIVPRVLSSFNGRLFKEVYRKKLRNLEFPVSVLSEAMKSKSQTEIKENCSQKVEGEFDVSSSFEVDLSDPCFNTLKMRYEVQKYHNCENISNGSIVSSFLIRIPPFVNYSLEFNDGNFDAPDRMFSSIEQSCGISMFSTSELVPELFLLPEMLSNKSSVIKLPEGVPDDVTLPLWSHQKSDFESNFDVGGYESHHLISCYNFVQMHRSVLESIGVRRQLSKWIDLVFGFKQSGEEAVNSLNVYNPLSYQSSVGSLPMLAKSSTLNLSQCQIKTIRADFVKNSGQMPLKIFSSPHQSYSMTSKEGANVSSSASLVSIGLREKRSSPIKKRTQPLFDKNSLFGFTFEDVVVRLNQKETIENAVLNREKGEILMNMTNYTFKMFNFDFFNATHISLSKRGDFLAVTFCTSKVTVFRLFYFDAQQNQNLMQQNQSENEISFSFNEISVLSRESVRFSVVNDRQNICASVCSEEVIIWSIINGFIINIIPIKNVKCLAFDEVLNLIYIGVGSKICQFSINGHLLFTIETNFEKQKNEFGLLFDSVEAIAVGGFGFSYDTRFIAVGKRSGHVMICKQNSESLDFEIVSIFEVSNNPIVKLITKQNNFLVEAVDSYKNSSTVF